MIIEYNEEEEFITVNGKKLSAEFFADLLDPDESWLYRFRKIGDEIVVERVVQMCTDAVDQANIVH